MIKKNMLDGLLKSGMSLAQAQILMKNRQGAKKVYREDAALANKIIDNENSTLGEIKGIGSSTAKKLIENGIKTREELISTPIEELKKIVSSPIAFKGINKFIEENI